MSGITVTKIELDHFDEALATRSLMDEVQRGAARLTVLDESGAPHWATTIAVWPAISGVYGQLKFVRPRESLEARFARLAAEWNRDTRYCSSIDEMVSHSAYQKIIKMGMPAVPFILQDLRRSGGFWFAALSAITHEDPLASVRSGNLKRLAELWIEWGEKNGYR